VRVALIDDGVQSKYGDLDDNIEVGMTFMPTPTEDGPTQRFTQNYNTSLYGHGTVMAYYIRRVCPKVRLFVAKLAGKQRRLGVGFSIKSAVDVSEAYSIAHAFNRCLLTNRNVTELNGPLLSK
jgi:hypothetical protein